MLWRGESRAAIIDDDFIEVVLKAVYSKADLPEIMEDVVKIPMQLLWSNTTSERFQNFIGDNHNVILPMMMEIQLLYGKKIVHAKPEFSNLLDLVRNAAIFKDVLNSSGKQNKLLIDIIIVLKTNKA